MDYKQTLAADPGKQSGDVKHIPQFGYVEPADYFPEEIRKKFNLGEYSEDDQNNA